MDEDDDDDEDEDEDEDDYLLTNDLIIRGLHFDYCEITTD